MANKKVDEPETKKGKGYKDAQWEAEVRKSLANKKKTSGPVTLSKQDLALVQAQLQKEAVIRKRVETIKSRLRRGLHFVHSLVKAQSDELRNHVSSIGSLLLEGAFGKAVTLVGSQAFDEYLVSPFNLHESRIHHRKTTGSLRLLFRTAGHLPSMGRCSYATKPQR